MRHPAGEQASLPELEQVWNTSWRVPPDVLPVLERLLRDGTNW